MAILPKIVFLFQNIPVHIPNRFFKDINHALSNFYWQGQRPRIRYCTLIRTQDTGGFGACDIKVYYKASLLQRALSWLLYRDTRIWTHLELKCKTPGNIISGDINHMEKLLKLEKHPIIKPVIKTILHQIKQDKKIRALSQASWH